MMQEKIPNGYAQALQQSEDITAPYIGWTREQKRELLTHALIARSGENAISASVSGTEMTLPKEEQERA